MKVPPDVAGPGGPWVLDADSLRAVLAPLLGFADTLSGGSAHGPTDLRSRLAPASEPNGWGDWASAQSQQRFHAKASADYVACYAEFLAQAETAINLANQSAQRGSTADDTAAERFGGHG